MPVDLHDPRALEALVELRALGVAGRNFYARADGGNAPYHARLPGSTEALLLREGAASRLVAADQALRAAGFSLFVLDAYRPIATQRSIWDFFIRLFRARNPGRPAHAIEADTLRFVSDPRDFDRDDARTWPLHATGGAVDVMLMDESGALDLGTAFDDATDAAGTAWFEQRLLDGECPPDDARLAARRVLYWSMREAGFTNYANEWWHYDFGNQMHIFTLRALGEQTGAQAAWYGYVDPPPAADPRP